MRMRGFLRGNLRHNRSLGCKVDSVRYRKTSTSVVNNEERHNSTHPNHIPGIWTSSQWLHVTIGGHESQQVNPCIRRYAPCPAKTEEGGQKKMRGLRYCNRKRVELDTDCRENFDGISERANAARVQGVKVENIYALQ
jgi:hypothetical protein